ncbi:MAG: hypothetical protein MRY83_02295 [Flavobacteriales bacterium]|nr:hypothetical protein [Flavobacteriales bacterium]
MHNSILITILLLIVTAYSTAKERKVTASFYISSSKLDKSINDGSSKITFSVSQDYTEFPDNSKIVMSYNDSDIEKTLSKDNEFELTLKPGKYVFKFFYNSDYEEIITDSVEIGNQMSVEAKLNFKHTLILIEVEKPVIYLYTEQATPVNISLDFKGDLGFTYPKYEGKWSFMAHPNGKLEFETFEHSYLFWDGQINQLPEFDPSTGFILSKSEVLPFLETSLVRMGFNSNEKEDFITYWGPELSQFDNVFLHFMCNSEYDQLAKLTIDPKPDTQQRIFMFWCPIRSEQLQVTPQNLPKFSRNGFHLLEWGGAQIDSKYLLPKL